MVSTDQLERARAAFEHRAWGDAFEEFSAAYRAGPLDAEDLERLSLAAHMAGRDDDSAAASDPANDPSHPRAPSIPEF